MSKQIENREPGGGAAEAGHGGVGGPGEDSRRGAPPAPDPLGLDDSQPPDVAAPSGRSGRGLAAFALLLALGALAGAGYLYYTLVYQVVDRSGAVVQRLDAVRATVDARLAEIETRVEGRLEEMAARQRQALEGFETRQAAARRAADAALESALADVSRRAPPSSGDWRQAEAQYLLRIANHRLLMERDVAGALQLLRTADAILAELDDFSVHPVRARLADETAALEGVQDVDLPGLFLRLEAAKRDLVNLPLRVPEFRAGAAGAQSAAPEPAATGPQATGQPGVLAELEHQLRGLLRVRRLDSEARPLLAPEESQYLELNLRLMLERAQLAAMNRDQLVFEESLASAAGWVGRYLQPEHPAVARLLEELATLQTVSLTQPLPDISGSLKALAQLERPSQ